MASNSSGKLNPSQTYKLGDYTFRLVVTYLSDEDITSVQCHASNGSSNKQTGKDYQGVITVKSWSVIAEDKTASIYINYEGKAHIQTNTTTGDFVLHIANHTWDRTFTRIGTGNSYATKIADSNGYTSPVTISETAEGTWMHCEDVLSPSFTTDLKNPSYMTVLDTRFYYIWGYGLQVGDPPDGKTVRGIIESIASKSVGNALIARFEINVQDAGGQTWDNPADVGEPSKTLNLTVAGALSGRHNDPINDSSYHYYPSDREQAEIYGSGGVGGNGGGGGAGASTVIVHQFGTDKAGSTDITAIAKRHGYGSGGGKGGKGGDGCILVYY